MSFDNFSSSVKLNNIKTYSGVKTTNNAFKNTFYSDIKEIDYSNYEEIDYNAIDLEKGKENVKDHKEWYEVLLEWDKKIKATKCVAITTLYSGVLKIVEYANDGLTWLGGMTTSGVARLVGQDELAEKIEEATMDEIARDIVGELNKSFYEGTEIGRNINEASAMKYDSELAKGIQNATTEVVIIAGATAATVATGGAAAVPLFAAGFAVGAGQSAENKFQDKENRDFWKDSVEIGVDGTIKGLSTMAYGKAGAAAFNGVKAISSLGFSGIKEVGKTTIKSFSKDAIKHTLKNTGKNVVKSTAINTLKDKDTWLETGSVLLDDVKTGIQTGEWNVARMLGDAALIYGENYLGNLGGGFTSELADYSKKMSRVNNIPAMNSNQRSNIMDVFDKERQVAADKYIVNFKTYREHAMLHTDSVTDYAVMLGLNLENIDDNALAEIYYGAYFHDLGMAGGGTDASGNMYGLNYNKKNGDYLGLIDDIVDTSTGKIDSDLAGQATRDNHPLNSALTVLTQDMVPDGIDKNKIALLALSHSKSTSGISSFMDKQQWEKAISKLDDAVKKYNQINGLTGKDAIVFEADKMREIISKPDDFKQLVDQALCIRDGDAMSALALTKDGHTIMQTGTIAYVDSPKLSLQEGIPSLDDELKDVVDIVKDKDNNELFKVDDNTGKLFHAGEENVLFNSSYNGTKYVGRVELVDVQKVPNSSIFVINERLGELATYTNCDRKFTIDLSTELVDTPYGESYVKALEDSIVGDINDAFAKLQKGEITRQQFDSVKDFYMNDIEVTGFDNFKIEWSEQ